MIKPPNNFYVFDAAHRAINNNIAGHGIQGGAHIVEVIWNPKRRRFPHPIQHYPWVLMNAGAVTERIFTVTDLTNRLFAITISNGGVYAVYNLYENICNFDILTLIFYTNNNSGYIDGQNVYNNTINPQIPNFTGLNIQMYLGDFVASYTSNICSFRLWNYPAGALPAGWEAEIHRRVMNPWQRSTVFDPTGTALKLEYLLDENNIGKNYIENTAQPGVGQLLITPVALFENATQLYKSE